MNITTILLILLPGAFVLGILWSMLDHGRFTVKKSAQLSERMLCNVYKSDNAGNDYPSYPGPLEEQDTEEYAIFLKGHILNILKFSEKDEASVDQQSESTSA